MEALIPIIVQLVSGVVGGGIGNSVLKNAAMGMLPKLLSGGIGGLAGGALAGGAIGDVAGGGMLGSIIGNAVGGGAGGAVVSGILGKVLGGKG